MLPSFPRQLAPVALALLLGSPAIAAPLGTAFTYQGELELSGVPVTGNYDFTFNLYNVASGGAPVAGPVGAFSVPVSFGLFSTTLDFSATPFNGTQLWLEIMVRPAGSGSFTLLAQRQAITATPYALYALNSGTPGSSQWLSDGHGNITYSGGAAGITGQSTHTATGVGVFFDGGNTSGGSVYGYNYNTSQGIPLYLNAPGANVLVGAVPSPGTAKLDVLATMNGIQSKTTGSAFNPGYNAAMVALGYTGNVLAGGAPCLGLYSASVDERGVWGISTNSYGVAANCIVSGNTAILAGPTEALAATSTNAAWPAGRFNAPTGGVAIEANGLVKVKTLQILGGADLAERFEVEGSPEPGTVLRIHETRPGSLRVCDEPYCARVAGVVSGANDLAAGIELGRDGNGAHSVPVALSGRVWVRCDAAAGAIHAGDLLTTAAHAGHAMRASDRGRAQGAILGKAMTSLETGAGLVLVLVSLQ